MFRSLKLVLLANTDWYLANFRFELAYALRESGAEVHCIAPEGRHLSWLSEQGFHTHALDLGPDSFSFAENHRTYQHLVSLYKKIQPDMAHHFTPRCVLLGSMAARKNKVPYLVNALSGLGHVFTTHSLKCRLARPVFRGLMKRYLNGDNQSVIFQNQEDMDELIAARVVDADRCHLIRGSGVNPDKFRPTSVERTDKEIRILLASRLIAEKGIKELAESMRQVVKSFPNAVLWLAGEPYAQNPTSLTIEYLRQLDKQPFIKLLGYVDDVAALMAQVDIVALPSYREGTPKVLLEAASCALPIVATDIAGCRGLVEDGESGFLVPVKNIEQLTSSIIALCEDKKLRKKMGKRGREIILEGFTSEIVTRKTFAVKHSLLLTKSPPIQTVASG
ncbi:MAG: glycosyltransferase family 4 protein [Gammaproteobacteria bacterium]|nr:glycosyltransferase family 4 protein [Gammaproteobacteria bacterium]